MIVRDFARNRGVEAADEQLFGIEVEIENYDGHVPSYREKWAWTGVEDGSLRNGGWELKSPSPWNLKACIEQYDLFLRAKKNRGWTSGVRTSTHVHANCLDLYLSQIGGIFATYAIVEPVLFKLCGDEREENIYCTPWYRAPREVDPARDLITRSRHHVLADACKYSALYIEPLRRFGTLEFRHAPVFETSAEFRLWMYAINQLLLYGQARDAATVLDEYLIRGPDEFVGEVFGPFAPRILARLLGESVAHVIESVDAVAQAEQLIPCTYKANWAPVTLNIEGEGHVGYHQLSHRGGAPRMPNLPVFDAVDYPEEEPY